MTFRDSRSSAKPWPRPSSAPRRGPARADPRRDLRPDLRAGLSAALLQAVRAQDFGRTADHWHGGAPLTHFPSIDLALAVFPPRGAPQYANVLFSREHPQGWAARIAPGAGSVQDVNFVADVQDAKGQSLAWQAGRNWKQMAWVPLANAAAASGPGSARFVAPYPASLLKLMVAVGLGLAVDRGLCGWDEVLPSVGPMLTVSSNEATDTCVAQLHRMGLLGGSANALNAAFLQHGLPTLQLNATTAAGGWRNADGAGVGHMHMTAWDTVRLLWLLDAEAPPPPWLPPATPPLLQPATRDALRALLAAQTLDEVLSSGRLRGQPGWVPGLPDAPAFAHKTGTTDNYASDAGIVRGGGAEGTHYIVALLSSLGRRYAATPACATTWRLPALGAAVHALATAIR